MAVQPTFEVSKVSQGSTTIVANDEFVHTLLDLLEADLDDGVKLHPALYALGERLTHRVDPGAHFGPCSARKPRKTA
jgi:hypothetical protein